MPIVSIALAIAPEPRNGGHRIRRPRRTTQRTWVVIRSSSRLVTGKRSFGFATNALCVVLRGLRILCAAVLIAEIQPVSLRRSNAQAPARNSEPANRW
jgi:hypothetical protein